MLLEKDPRFPGTPSGLLKTFWLFTRSDVFTFVIPVVIFGVAAALSGPLLTSNKYPSLLDILTRLPSTITWTWTNTLVFDFANQRSPDSAAEDAVNKPSRPIPAGRITCEQTRKLLLWSLPALLLLSFILGPWQETALLVILTWMYNDLGGSDDHWLLRNGIIAVAFSQYNKGALRIVARQDFDIPDCTWLWLVITSSVILTTVHWPDLKDQEGDRMRGRSTAPLALGDGFTRWTLAVATAVWSVLCPAYWQGGLLMYALTMSVGAVMCVRVLMLRTAAADKKTWYLWALWIMIIWLLPVFKDHSVFVRALDQFAGMSGLV